MISEYLILFINCEYQNIFCQYSLFFRIQGGDAVMDCVHNSETGRVEVYLSYNDENKKINKRLPLVSWHRQKKYVIGYG